MNKIHLNIEKETIIEAAFKNRLHLLLSGESGTGKTESLEWFAFKHDLPTYKVNCAVIQSPKDWYGTKSLNKEGTFYEKSGLFRFLETHDDGVVIFDEINRTNQKNVSALYPLLDDQKTISVPELEVSATIGNNIMFCGTVNEGVRYTGVSLIDAALKRRFIPIHMDYPDEKVQKTILKERFPTVNNRHLSVILYILTYTQQQYKNGQYTKALSVADGIKYLKLLSSGVPLTYVINESVLSEYYDGDDGKEIIADLSLTVDSNLSEFLK